MRANGVLVAISCPPLISMAQSATFARNLNTRGIEYPSFRFRPYSTLDEETTQLAKSIGYDEYSWNNLSSNPWEVYSFATIQSDGSSMVVNSIETMGFTPEVWDCYINHYRDYTWQQLADAGVVVFAVVLGWSETMWDGMTSTPETEFMLWDEMSTGLQQAAAELCFTQEIWDQVNLEDWGSLNDTSGEPTGSEGNSPSPPLVASPMTPPSKAPSGNTNAVTRSPVADRNSPAPTVQQSVAPVDPPTVSPTAQQNIPESAKPSKGTQETDEPTQIQQNDDGSPSLPSVDDIRYVVWDSLPDDKKGLAGDLGYDQDSWNTPGTADIEYYSIQGLYDADLKNDAEKIAELGFSDEQWDCYIHHYISYSWERLVEVEVDRYFISLGWSQASWDGENSEVPASEGKTWDELTEEERAGAMGLCYMLQTWDGYSLDDDAWITAAEATQKPLSERGDNPSETVESGSLRTNNQMRFSMLLVVYVSTIFVV